MAILASILLLLAACATDDGDAAGETGVLTPEPSPTMGLPHGSPHEGPGGDVAPESCNGQIGAVIVERVEVPDGETSCTLDGTTVEGNVQVGEGATLEARGVRVDGDVQAQGALAVNVVDSQVAGNIQVEDGSASRVLGTTIDGDLQWESQAGALEASGNQIDGNLQAEDNTGGLVIEDNTIRGNLQCSGNDPAPTGSGNRVEGDMEDQCAAL